MTFLDRIDRALAAYLDRAVPREGGSIPPGSVPPGSVPDAGLAAEARELVVRSQLLDTVVNTLPLAILMIDDLGKIVMTNTEAQALFFEGKSPEGENFLQLLGSVHPGLRQALLSEEDHIFSFGDDGEAERYHLARRALTFGGGPHSLIIVRNIQSELSRQENAVLRKAIRVIHHEFANSLTPVRSLLQGARAKVGRPEWGAKLEQTLGVIEDRVLHLSAFLTGFAALGRLPEARPQEVAWDTFLGRLGPLLGDIVLAPAPPGRGWFDPAQLEQVLINLVKNAREAGSPVGDICLQVLPAPEGGYRASVLDRGQGMNDEALENATVPSFTTKADGSGMGLTLCREIIDAHRGRLRIARREGGGISVSCWLPPRDAPLGHTGASLSRLSLTRS